MQKKRMLLMILILFLLFSILSCKKTSKKASGGFESPREEIALTEVAYELITEGEANISDNLELFYTVYRVKPGDVTGHIAEYYNISDDAITSVNGVTNTRRLQIGSYLKIPSIKGVLHTTVKNDETLETIAQKYAKTSKEKILVENIALVNNLVVGDKLKAGTAVFVPNGELDWVTRQEINGDLFRRPLRGRYWISSDFGYRNSPFTGKRSYHNGVDMAAPRGTKVYATLAGRVTTAGWNNTYGNYIIVSHHSGYKTLYAHMTHFNETKDSPIVGRWVTADSILGYVGSTGLSTGDHLHFTVFKNGRAVNPRFLWN